MRLIAGVVERTIAFLLLLAVGPVILLLGLAIWLLSGRTPLVAIRRVGWRGASLRMLKLRTMWPRKRAGRQTALIEQICEQAVPPVKNGQDSRVTSPLAMFCRRYSLDELPQLWHVMTGEMSFVGPRPLTACELASYYGADSAKVLEVKPGLTGLWQTRGRSRLSYRQRKRFDLFLARHKTASLCADILWRTVPRVLSGRDAW